MAKHTVATEDELEDGDRTLIELEGKDIGVFNINGEYHAFASWCPHQGGPCCEGAVTGTSEASFDRDTLTVELDWTKDDEVLNCPWHGWEFDITSGQCLSDDRFSLPSYPVEVEDGKIIVDV